MARATYIYMVTWMGRPIACFTVKKECIAWCERYGLMDHTVRRVPDGVYKTPEAAFGVRMGQAKDLVK